MLNGVLEFSGAALQLFLSGIVSGAVVPRKSHDIPIGHHIFPDDAQGAFLINNELGSAGSILDRNNDAISGEAESESNKT